MSKSVTLSYTPTQQDYAAVLRAFFWQRTQTRISLVFLAIAFILVFIAIGTTGFKPNLFELVWLIFPPAFVLFVFVIQPRRMASQAGRNEQLTSVATWVVSEAGVEIKARSSATQLDWDTLQKLVRTKDYYLLLSRVNKNAFRFLPRRAFTTPQQEEMFLDLVVKNIKRK
jgi:hypothetical protein